MAKLDYYTRSIRGLSYSRRLVLHSCPHKFELAGSYNLLSRTNSITFAFGHAVAMGMQVTIAGSKFNDAILATWLEYDHDLNDNGTASEQSSKKSVHHAVLATELFYKKYHAGAYPYLDGWEVAEFKDPVTGKVRKAIELTYVIDIVDGFTEEGHIDLVLYNPTKNRYMVVEIKTTGGYKVDEASYKYSDQPLGYGIVLDYIAAQQGGTASFDILYLVWKSRSKELVALPFSKSIRDRARWFQEVLMDVEYISNCEQTGHFPHRGESCFSYFRPCEYFSECKSTRETLLALSEQRFKEQEEEQFAKMVDPTFKFTIEELLARQNELAEDIAQGKSLATDVDSVDLLFQASTPSIME